MEGKYDGLGRTGNSSRPLTYSSLSSATLAPQRDPAWGLGRAGAGEQADGRRSTGVYLLDYTGIGGGGGRKEEENEANEEEGEEGGSDIGRKMRNRRRRGREEGGRKVRGTLGGK